MKTYFASHDDEYWEIVQAGPEVVSDWLVVSIVYRGKVHPDIFLNAEPFHINPDGTRLYN